MLNSAPNWAPMLLVPAGLLYFAKQSMDRADRRSRNMAVTSAVGRAVVGTLDPERAVPAIADRAGRVGLRLAGPAFLRLADPGVFQPTIPPGWACPSWRGTWLDPLVPHPRHID